MPNGAVRGAFDQGQAPTISCFNKATVPLGVDFDRLIAAMQKYVDQHFAPVWGTPAKLVKTNGFVKKTWAMVFLDNADVQGALAYHDLTPDGLPLAKVFVKTTLQNGDKVSVSASHELVEMLADPAINLMSTGPKNMIYAYETADPVEQEEFLVDGIAMSNFVYPAYFEAFRKANSDRFDHLGKVKRPFQILSGGYQIVLKSGKWTQIYGSKAKEKRFKKEDRRGHRSTYRGKPPVKISKADSELVMDEITFIVEEAPEGGYIARALGASIFTEAGSLDALHDKVRDAVRCHFDEPTHPKVIRLHHVRQEIISA